MLDRLAKLSPGNVWLAAAATFKGTDRARLNRLAAMAVEALTPLVPSTSKSGSAISRTASVALRMSPLMPGLPRLPAVHLSSNRRESALAGPATKDAAQVPASLPKTPARWG